MPAFKIHCSMDQLNKVLVKRQYTTKICMNFIDISPLKPQFPYLQEIPPSLPSIYFVLNLRRLRQPDPFSLLLSEWDQDYLVLPRRPHASQLHISRGATVRPDLKSRDEPATSYENCEHTAPGFRSASWGCCCTGAFQTVAGSAFYFFNHAQKSFPNGLKIGFTLGPGHFPSLI